MSYFLYATIFILLKPGGMEVREGHRSLISINIVTLWFLAAFHYSPLWFLSAGKLCRHLSLPFDGKFHANGSVELDRTHLNLGVPQDLFPNSIRLVWMFCVKLLMLDAVVRMSFTVFSLITSQGAENTLLSSHSLLLGEQPLFSELQAECRD